MTVSAHRIGMAIAFIVFFVYPGAGYADDKPGMIVTVPDDYKGIQDAIDACLDGGTVFIKAGTYEIAKTLDLKAGVTLLGSGADATTLSGSAAIQAAQNPEQGSLVIAADRTRIGYVCLRGAGACGIYIRGMSDDVQSAAVDHAVIFGCAAGVAFNNRYTKGTMRLTNNTIVKCGVGISDNDWNEVFMYGNIIVGGKIGVKKFNVLTWTAEYNLVFSNAVRDWDGLSPSATNLSRDPRFTAADRGDFHLSAGSPCIDAGLPDASSNDADGSRSDLGALAYKKQ